MSGAFYSHEVSQAVAEDLGFDMKNNRGTDRAEGGDFGMDVYYASVALDQHDARTHNEAVWDATQPQAGEKLGALVLDNGERLSNASIHDVDEAHKTVRVVYGRLKPGVTTRPAYRMTLSAVKEAMDSAHRLG